VLFSLFLITSVQLTSFRLKHRLFILSMFCTNMESLDSPRVLSPAWLLCETYFDVRLRALRCP